MQCSGSTAHASELFNTQLHSSHVFPGLEVAVSLCPHHDQ